MKVKIGMKEVKNSLIWVQFDFGKRKTNYCNLEMLKMKVKKKTNVNDAINFVFDRTQSDLSGLVWSKMQYEITFLITN